VSYGKLVLKWIVFTWLGAWLLVVVRLLLALVTVPMVANMLAMPKEEVAGLIAAATPTWLLFSLSALLNAALAYHDAKLNKQEELKAKTKYKKTACESRASASWMN